MKGKIEMCITREVLNKVRSTIEENNMFDKTKENRLVIGVSGGADSVMLLNVMNTLKDEYNLHIVVAHVNHKIRKGDAENDAEFVRQMCENMGIEYHLREAEIPALAKEWGLGEEEAGRRVRYGFFAELAGENGKIATAHNANDNVETVIMRFMRGTGVAGLSGISYKRDNIVRPILGVSRADIEAYLEENGLTHITDKTNFEAIYTRNKIRLNLIPYIQETFNPNIINTLTSNIQTYSEDADYFEFETQKAYKQYVYKQKDGTVCVKFNMFKEVHSAIGKRVMIKAIKEAKGTEQIGVNASRIDEIYKNLVDSTVGSVYEIGEEYELYSDYCSVIIQKKENEKNMDEVLVNIDDGSFEFDETVVNVSVEYANNIDNNGVTCYLPMKYKNKTLTVRTRRDGDTFRVNEKIHKKLNRVLTDKKISKNERDKQIFLFDGDEALWCIGEFATRFDKRDGQFVKFQLKMA